MNSWTTVGSRERRSGILVRLKPSPWPFRPTPGPRHRCGPRPSIRVTDDGSDEASTATATPICALNSRIESLHAGSQFERRCGSPNAQIIEGDHGPRASTVWRAISTSIVRKKWGPDGFGQTTGNGFAHLRERTSNSAPEGTSTGAADRRGRTERPRPRQAREFRAVTVGSIDPLPMRPAGPDRIHQTARRLSGQATCEWRGLDPAINADPDAPAQTRVTSGKPARHRDAHPRPCPHPRPPHPSDAASDAAWSSEMSIQRRRSARLPPQRGPCRPHRPGWHAPSPRAINSIAPCRFRSRR